MFQEFDGSVGHQTLGTARVAAAHVVFKGWSLIDGKCLIKDIEPVDPLAVGIDRIFSDQDGFAGPIADHGQAHALVVQHGPFGRIVGRDDPLAVHSSIIARAPALRQWGFAGAARAFIDGQNGRRRRGIGWAVERLIEICGVIEVFLIKLGQDVQRPRQLLVLRLVFQAILNTSWGEYPGLLVIGVHGDADLF